MTSPPGQIDVQTEFTERLTVHKNLGQDVIVVTMDKIRLCLIKHRDSLANKHEWLTPFGLFVSLGTTLVAADFKEFVLSKPVWEAVFIIACLVCGVWFMRAAMKAWRHRDAGDIESILRELAAQQSESSTRT